jgi:hypothetical protein
VFVTEEKEEDRNQALPGASHIATEELVESNCYGKGKWKMVRMGQ